MRRFKKEPSNTWFLSLIVIGCIGLGGAYINKIHNDLRELKKEYLALKDAFAEVIDSTDDICFIPAEEGIERTSYHVAI